jgi:PAS domain S-box-containing protein
LPYYGLLIIRFEKKTDCGILHSIKPVFAQLANACMVTDKLELLSTENEQANSERRLLHAIIDNIPDPLYVKDTSGRKILANKAEADLLGIQDVKTLIGKKDSEIYPAEVAEKTEAEDLNIIATGKSVIHRDGMLNTADGKEFWVRGTKIPYSDEKGNIIGIIGISHNISENKKIENELRVVAEKYKSIFNSFVDLYYRSDLSGTILDLSPSVYKLSGYKPDELIGKSVSHVYADIESRHRMLELLFSKGSINDYENLLIRKDGKHIPVSITSHVIKSGEKQEGYIEGTIRDISERKESEAKLNKLLRLQNLLTHLATEFINIPVENSNEAVDRLLSVIGQGNEIDRVYIFEYDFSKNTMSNTHEWCARDVSPEKDTLQDIDNNLLPDWVNTHKEGHMLVVEDVSSLNPSDNLYQILHAQGIKTLITIPLMLENECLGFVGFDSVRAVKTWNADEITFLQVLADLLCNVTDRKRKEEKLRNREASLKAIFNNVPYQMWLKDVDSKYLAVNQPFMDYFSITSENDILGNDASQLWGTETGHTLIEQDKAVMNNREVSSVEQLVKFNHKSAWFEIFRAPIVDQDGNLLGTTGVARDITSRKNAEKALQEAVSAAESANKAKSSFLAIMSHEIRNPLNAIVGMVRMLHEAHLEGPESKLIDNIKTSSDQLLMIINDILDFSKIESGEMILEETPFNIRDVITRVFNSHVFIAKEKNIELNWSVDNSLADIHIGDPLRLQQVISNLTSNAVKFTPKGSINIRCITESQTSEKIKVRFEVEDTGIGISEQNQKIIFESFKQEDDSISRMHGGSGLGLAISKQIVELMGGTLAVESKKNEGSRFYFSVELTEANSGKLSQATPSKTEESFSLKGRSVLLVEDNKLNQILAVTMLEKWETRVVVAANGQQALETLENETFDIILMDIQMPVMDGMTASKLIREKLKLKTPILALTANVVKGIVEKCEEAGMQGYISKPFEAEELLRKITANLSKKTTKANGEFVIPEMMVADLSRLEKMIGPDRDQLAKMVQKFLEITPAYVSELNKGEQSDNIELIASSSHKIKSSIDLVARDIMRDLILSINHTSRKGGEINDIRPMILRFNELYKLLEKQLSQQVGQLQIA